MYLAQRKLGVIVKDLTDPVSSPSKTSRPAINSAQHSYILNDPKSVF